MGFIRGEECPGVHQVWVADDGMFGMAPDVAQRFMTMLESKYALVSLRLSREKLQCFGVVVPSVTGGHRKIRGSLVLR